MKNDAVDLLLRDKPHADAQKLLAFQHAHQEFLPAIVAELRWLKRTGRKAGGIKALIHFLRLSRDWRAVDEFKINDHLSPCAIRVCTLLWPDLEGMVQFRRCAADNALGTSIEERGRGYTNVLV